MFVTLMLICATALSSGTAWADQRVFVSAEDAGEIVVIHAVTGHVVDRIKVGRRPRGLKLSADGKLLYVAVTGTPKPDVHGILPKSTPQDRAADGVAVVDVVGGKLLRTLKAGQAPAALDLSPDGKTAYVTNSETAEVSVLDLASGKILKKIGVGPEPEGVAFRPDGKVVYVTSVQASEVYAIDSVKMQLLTRIDAGGTPRSVVFSRNGAVAFVTNEQGASVTWLDGGRHAFISSLFMLHDPKLHDAPQPVGVVLSPDGKSLFVSSGRSGSVLVLDATKPKLVRAIDRVGGFPRGIGISRDGKTLFTANGSSNDVSIIDVASGKIEKRVQVGGGPWGLVVAGP